MARSKLHGIIFIIFSTVLKYYQNFKLLSLFSHEVGYLRQIHRWLSLLDRSRNIRSAYTSNQIVVFCRENFLC